MLPPHRHMIVEVDPATGLLNIYQCIPIQRGIHPGALGGFHAGGMDGMGGMGSSMGGMGGMGLPMAINNIFHSGFGGLGRMGGMGAGAGADGNVLSFGEKGGSVAVSPGDPRIRSVLIPKAQWSLKEAFALVKGIKGKGSPPQYPKRRASIPDDRIEMRDERPKVAALLKSHWWFKIRPDGRFKLTDKANESRPTIGESRGWRYDLPSGIIVLFANARPALMKGLAPAEDLVASLRAGGGGAAGGANAMMGMLQGILRG